MKYLLIVFTLVTIQANAAHLINRQEEQKYLKNLDTIIIDHSGIDRIIFNSDTIFLEMVQPMPVHEVTFEQHWVNMHPILFTLIVAALTVVAEVELFKMVLRK